MAWSERYVRADAAGGGNGTTDANSGANGAYTLAEAITHSATNTGIRYNVKAGVYANAATGRTFNGNGTTTAPNWWRGFKTTAGDLTSSSNFGTAHSGAECPAFTFTSATATFSGNHQIVTNIDFLATTNTSRVLNVTGSQVRVRRCRVENQNAGASSFALSNATSGNNVFTDCWFKATATATAVVSSGISGTFINPVVEGGGNGFTHTGGSLVLVGFLIKDVGGDGINIALVSGTTTINIFNGSIYSPGGDGIEIAANLPGAMVIAGVVIHSPGSGVGINNSSGANTNNITRVRNSFYNCATANESGFGDSPASDELTEASDPFTDAAGGNYTLVSGALSTGANAPAKLHNTTVSSYGDRGGIQRQGSAGSSRKSIIA